MKKKVRERLFLDEVAGLYSEFPCGAINASERPDFLIAGCSGVIGIELVDYVRGQTQGDSQYRRDEVLRQRIADAAMDAFEVAHKDPLMVHFHWYPHRYLRSAHVEQLAAEAAAVISTAIPASLFGQVTVDYHGLEQTELSRYCHSIIVTRVRDQEQTLWSSVNAGFVSVQAIEIQYLVASKERKLSEYLLQCDDAWWLMSSNRAAAVWVASTSDRSRLVRRVWR